MTEAKQKLQPELTTGTTCECCGQYAKIYIRPLTSSMALALIIFYHAAADFEHAEMVFKKANINSSIRGDFPKLRFFGLIEAKAGEKEDGNKNNGYYRVTEKGEQFIQKLITVPASATIYNNACIGFSEKQINIEEALKNKFSYDKLMKGEYS